MNHTILIFYNINPSWNIVDRVRNDVKASLQAFPEEIRHASMMTASELMENAVKYSSRKKNGTGVKFKMSADDLTIRITITNFVENDEYIAALTERIDRIKAAFDYKSLYITRLRQLTEHYPDDKTGLGLYRIAYEGKFSLSYVLDDHTITMRAVRCVLLHRQLKKEIV